MSPRPWFPRTGIGGTPRGFNQALNLGDLRKRRRKLIKRYGKRLFKRLNVFLAEQSKVPTTRVLDSELFPWVRELEAALPSMQSELSRLLRYRDALPKVYEISRDNSRISDDGNWTSFVFSGFGYRAEHNCSLCPATAAGLEKVPRLQTAFFSIMRAGAQVPRHKGVAKGLLRCHLPLIVPEKRDDCYMILGGETVIWQEGRAVVFDDTFPHEVHNNTDQDRVVLLFDFERPMRPLGRYVSRLLLFLMRHTGYVRDAVRNYSAWEAKFRRLLDEDDSKLQTTA